MSLTAFPEPADLQVDFVNRTGDSKPKSFQKYDVTNPHPGYGKDPNILNEFGHTKYPMYVGTVIVHNEEEELAVRGVAKVEPPVVNWDAVKPQLREDGPTVHEWVAAGFSAKEYPPKGYSLKSTKEEIEQAIKDEEAAAAKSSGWGV
jgi:hypothetical protein